MQEYKTISEKKEEIFLEKKSKFIATIIPISSEEEAEIRIKELKKQYFDARHNCYAYIVNTENGLREKSSDDGEPSGTAGAPILNVLKQNGLINVLMVVTRYFGGILLGAGGLIRAYSNSAINVINQSKVIIKRQGYEYEIILPYSELDKFKYLAKKNNIKIINEEYFENIKLTIDIEKKTENLILNLNNNPINILKIEKLKEKYI